MAKRIISLILILLLSASSLCACSKSAKQTAECFDYFDTYSSLTSYCEKENFEIYEKEFHSLLKQYHELFDIYNSYGDVVNLKALNEQAAISPVRVCDELFDALMLASNLHSITQGKFNVSIGALTSIWHDARIKSLESPESAYIPSQDEISDALIHTDIRDLILDESNHTVFFADSRLSLDFGAIAKGYVASLLYERLVSLGCDNFLINLGGNVVSYGKKPQGKPWLVMVENPLEDKSLGYNEEIALEGETLVTSGSYQRFFTYNEKQYSHIIDPSSGYPADIFTSVSIQAPASSSALADALSTALFCISYEDGRALVERLEGVEALWIFKDGAYKATSGFGGTK